MTIVSNVHSPRLTAVSLFSSGGIGDLALRAVGVDILVSNERLADRHAAFEFNFPETLAITGNVRAKSDEIVDATRRLLRERTLDVFYATPPCQGMSKNGRGKLLNGIRAGRKPGEDERNRLIIPTMNLARQLKPRIVLLENVPEMADTVILDDDGNEVGILDFVTRQLGPTYRGTAEVVEFADYGVPQCRQRLITVFSCCPRLLAWISDWGSLMPVPTHSRDGIDGTRRWVSVRDAIGQLPALDAGSRETSDSGIPYHRVPLLDPMKYWWVRHTPPEKSAFDNQCPACGFKRNPTHGARRDESGINRASRKTPLFCQECGEMLPRPSVEAKGARVLMRGFTSAYKRMSFDKPASALTRNLSYACSDNKLHPEQNRVLSLYEAFRLHTIDRFRYSWNRRDGRPVSDKTIREIIGESIPPAGFQAIVEHVLGIYRGRCDAPPRATLGPLFAASSASQSV